MVIRLLGIIVGLLFIVLAPVMAYNQVESLAMCLSIFLMGIVFLVYGVKGNQGLLKILPKNSNLKLW
ncbi:hypothetical protein [Paraglaciecola arctica]|uniref:hypothetical protein n=1 Tax=Paraglaciecola arctica TaxID=1128911 RepID=UPI001C067470|nr:hypothetical protein [Paraglaciecola arctica]MBU3003114.1 hypothetical protein [Paraglaciecola arctica]